MNKYYIILETMPNNQIYAGINDDSYYGDGQIISEHNNQEEAEQACKLYSITYNIPLFEDYREDV